MFSSQVGINTGSGEHYTVDDSGTQAIADTVVSYGTCYPGVWIFRINELDVVAGNCYLEGRIDTFFRFAWSAIHRR